MSSTIRDFQKGWEASHPKWRETLLVDVANLKHSEQFWRRWQSSLQGHKLQELPSHGWMPRKQASEAELLHIRDRLRDVWDRKDSAPSILQEWLLWTNKEIPTFVMSQQEGVTPNVGNLRFQLVLGICELAPKLAYCQADGCPSPYFVRYRDERQQFCDRKECLEFGQRLHKREWARRSRAEQKLKAAKKSRKQQDH